MLSRLSMFNYYLKCWLFLSFSAAHLCGLKWDLDCLINNRLWSTSLGMEFSWREKAIKSCKCNCMIGSSPSCWPSNNLLQERGTTEQPQYLDLSSKFWITTYFHFMNAGFFIIIRKHTKRRKTCWEKYSYIPQVIVREKTAKILISKRELKS